MKKIIISVLVHGGWEVNGALVPARHSPPDHMQKPRANHFHIPKCIHRSSMQNLQSGSWRAKHKSLKHSLQELCYVFAQRGEIRYVALIPSQKRGPSINGNIWRLGGTVGWCLI